MHTESNVECLLYLPALFICAEYTALPRLCHCQSQLLLAAAVQPQHEQRVRRGAANQVQQRGQAGCLQIELTFSKAIHVSGKLVHRHMHVSLSTVVNTNFSHPPHHHEPVREAPAPGPGLLYPDIAHRCASLAAPCASPSQAASGSRRCARWFCPLPGAGRIAIVSENTRMTMTTQKALTVQGSQAPTSSVGAVSMTNMQDPGE
jgi:hypothetical protein